MFTRNWTCRLSFSFFVNCNWRCSGVCFQAPFGPFAILFSHHSCMYWPLMCCHPHPLKSSVSSMDSNAILESSSNPSRLLCSDCCENRVVCDPHVSSAVHAWTILPKKPCLLLEFALFLVPLPFFSCEDGLHLAMVSSTGKTHRLGSTVGAFLRTIILLMRMRSTEFFLNCNKES